MQPYTFVWAKNKDGRTWYHMCSSFYSISMSERILRILYNYYSSFYKILSILSIVQVHVKRIVHMTSTKLLDFIRWQYDIKYLSSYHRRTLQYFHSCFFLCSFCLLVRKKVVKVWKIVNFEGHDDSNSLVFW